jgi:hypothetical protein
MSAADDGQAIQTAAEMICSGTPPSALWVGAHGRVPLLLRGTVRMRTEPATSASIIHELVAGDEFDVIRGPICGSYAWWQIQLTDGTVGWAAEGDDTQYFVEPLPYMVEIEGVSMQPTNVPILIESGSTETRDLEIAELGRLDVSATSIDSFAFSHDSLSIAVEEVSGTVSLWNTGTLQRLQVLPMSGVSNVTSIAFSPNNRLLAVAYGHILVLWNLEQVQVAAQVDLGRASGCPLDCANEYPNDIFDLGFSPDGSMLATGSRDGLRLWNGSTLQTLGSPLQGHDGGVLTLAFSHDGERVMTGGGEFDGKVILWSIQDDYVNLEREWIANNRLGIYDATFAYDGDTLNTLDSAGNVHVWNVSSGALLRTLSASSNRYLGFSTDGEYVFGYPVADPISRYNTTSLVLWNIDTVEQAGVVTLANTLHMVSEVVVSQGNLVFAVSSQEPSSDEAILKLLRVTAFPEAPRFELRYRLNDGVNEIVEVRMRNVSTNQEGTIRATVEIYNRTSIAYGAAFSLVHGNVGGQTITYLLANPQELPVLMPHTSQSLGEITFYPETEIEIRLSKNGFALPLDQDYLQGINSLIFLSSLANIGSFPTGDRENPIVWLRDNFGWFWRNVVENAALTLTQSRHLTLALLFVQSAFNEREAQFDSIIDFLEDNPELAVTYLRQSGINATVNDVRNGAATAHLARLAQNALPVIEDYVNRPDHASVVFYVSELPDT